MEENNDETDLLFNFKEEIVPKKKSNKGNIIENVGKKNTFSAPVNNDTGNESRTKFMSKNSSARQHFKKKSDVEHVRTSSIFKNNPEIPALKVEKQKAFSEPLFSKKTYKDLNLHPHLVSCLEQRLGVVTLTKVQERAIPVFLNDKDCLVKSCTGSGKTLAYAVPIVQKLQEYSPKIKRQDGIFALIIVPTRELALQCFECFSALTKAFTWIVPGYLIGGEKKKSEKARLRKGINILISTPGRLLDHLDTTACLTLEKIQWLIIDEADKLLEQGFEESVTRIISKCQVSRQTALLSATLTKGVERLAGMSLTDPIQIDVASEEGNITGEFQEFSLPSHLKQSVVVVPSKLRLAVMSAFIIDKYHQNAPKGLVFMCSQGSVDFHYALLSSVLTPLLRNKGHKGKFFRMHGNMKQEERTEIFNVFRSAKEGILFCTDVAARGLDLPEVDWILQYSVPLSPEIYVHRVGRTARIGKKGRALLFLLPTELKFSQLLSQRKIEFDEIDVNKILQSLLLIGDSLTLRAKISVEDCATALHTRYEKEVYAEEELHQSAKDAFASYVQSYASYPKEMKEILPFKALHLGHVAKSFCIREAPSELGCSMPNSGYRSKIFRKNEDRRPQKRKRSMISEFDSGLSSVKHMNNSNNSPQKRRKQSMISEFDSGLSSVKHINNSNNSPQKRRKQSMISEFDSGLSSVKHTNNSNNSPQKRRKHSMISEFDSGLPSVKHISNSNNSPQKRRNHR